MFESYNFCRISHNNVLQDTAYGDIAVNRAGVKFFRSHSGFQDYNSRKPVRVPQKEIYFIIPETEAGHNLRHTPPQTFVALPGTREGVFYVEEHVDGSTVAYDMVNKDSVLFEQSKDISVIHLNYLSGMVR